MVELQRRYKIVHIIGLLILAACAWASLSNKAYAGGSSSTGGILPHAAAKLTTSISGMGLRGSFQAAGIPHRQQP